MYQQQAFPHQANPMGMGMGMPPSQQPPHMQMVPQGLPQGMDIRGGRGGMRVGYGRGFGGRGGGGQYIPSGPGFSDTLRVTITNLQHPVTEQLIEQVFAPVAKPININIYPPRDSQILAIVQFAGPQDAEKALTERNGREIYSGCLSMSITYHRGQFNFRDLSQHPGMGPNGILGIPSMRGGRGNDHYAQHAQGGYPGAAPIHVGGMGQGAPYWPGGMGGPMGMPQQMGMGFNPMGNMNVMVGRGRGRAMGRVGVDIKDCVWVSVAMYNTEEPLQHLFTLLECYGGVISMRRTYKNPQILTVKCTTPDDANNICKYLRQVPFGGMEVNGRLFPTFEERQPVSNDGDPLNKDTLAYDFTSSRHRGALHRCTCGPTNELIISGCAQKCEADLMNYFSSKGFFPESIQKNEEEGVFIVKMDTAVSAIKLLVECQTDVCDGEKTNIQFYESETSVSHIGGKNAQTSPSNARNNKNDSENQRKEAAADGVEQNNDAEAPEDS
eukprot:Tbor_TRINITY_DN5328_c3_g4::TRINITY_DN5328_c3_g4_i1::g.3820::m.3820